MNPHPIYNKNNNINIVIICYSVQLILSKVDQQQPDDEAAVLPAGSAALPEPLEDKQRAAFGLLELELSSDMKVQRQPSCNNDNEIENRNDHDTTAPAAVAAEAAAAKDEIDRPSPLAPQADQTSATTKPPPMPTIQVKERVVSNSQQHSTKVQQSANVGGSTAVLSSLYTKIMGK